jgi:hypothetical protein
MSEFRAAEKQKTKAAKEMPPLHQRATPTGFLGTLPSSWLNSFGWRSVERNVGNAQVLKCAALRHFFYGPTVPKAAQGRRTPKRFAPQGPARTRGKLAGEWKGRLRSRVCRRMLSERMGGPNMLESRAKPLKPRVPLASIVGLGTLLVAALALLWILGNRPDEKELPGATNIGLRPGLPPGQRLTAQINERDVEKCLVMYLELTGRRLWPATNRIALELDDATGGRLTRWKWISPSPRPDSGITYHADGALTAAEVKDRVEAVLDRANLRVVPVGTKYLRVQSKPAAAAAP